MKLIKDLGVIYPSDKAKHKRRCGIYECPICFEHKQFTTKNIKNGRSTKCKSCAVTMSNTTHGDRHTRLYSIWSSMKARCYNEKSKNYEYYGGKGIKVQSEFHDYTRFKEWALLNGYEEHLSIDRIDGSKWYSSFNCRWVTKETQSRNVSKLRKDNTSGYRGVCKHTTNNNYIASIRVDGKRKHIGCYDTAKKAGIAYNKFIDDNSLEHTRNTI